MARAGIPLTDRPDIYLQFFLEPSSFLSLQTGWSPYIRLNSFGNPTSPQPPQKVGVRPSPRSTGAALLPPVARPAPVRHAPEGFEAAHPGHDAARPEGHRVLARLCDPCRCAQTDQEWEGPAVPEVVRRAQAPAYHQDALEATHLSGILRLKASEFHESFGSC